MPSPRFVFGWPEKSPYLGSLGAGESFCKAQSLWQNPPGRVREGPGRRRSAIWDYAFWLYLATATVLVVHEIDSAYWREWELFGLPGGPAFFLLLHVPLVWLVLYGLVQVYDATSVGRWAAYLLGAAGLLVPVLHGGFLRQGRPEFRTPVSLALIVLAGVLGAALILVSLSLP